jgi:putative hemolysin
MKILYMLAFAIIIITSYVVYKDRTKWINPVSEYATYCNEYDGTTYMAKSKDDNVVLLCVNPEVFLVPPQIIEK